VKLVFFFDIDFRIWCLIEGFLVDVAGDIHGLVKDAGDFHAISTHSIKNQVFADPECTAAIGQVVSDPTAGKKGVVNDAGSGGGENLKVSDCLLHSPGLDGVAEDVGKIPLCEFR
jgi:hypothetical protein